MQNQAEVNFSKWHFNNSQFSKVNLCQKSNSKVKVKLPKSNFRKCNFKRQISNVKFQVEFPTCQIFKENLSKSNSHSNFQSPISKVNSRLSERAFQSPPLFESQTIQIQTLESETFQSPISTDRHISKANIFQVKSTTRFGSIESRQRRKSSIRKSVCSLRFFSAAEKT